MGRLRDWIVRKLLPRLPGSGGFSGAFSRARFDSDGYLAANPDVAAAKIDPYDHFRRYGRFEGRSARFIGSGGQAETRYRNWIEAYEIPSAVAAAPHPENGPRISILMAVFNPDPRHLHDAIQSVRGQLYGNWELCIADDASTDPAVKAVLERFRINDARIRVAYRERNGHISEASNTALSLVTGDYTGLLDHDDLLSCDALEYAAAAIAAHPEAHAFYSDEDKVDTNGARFSPYFKGAFNPELMLAQNMVCHFGVYRTSTLRDLGGFRSGLDGAQDYDLALRLSDTHGPAAFRHIPHILYHWRAGAGSTALSIETKPYATLAGQRAVADHLSRRGIKAGLEPAPLDPGHHRVRPLPTTGPQAVSLIASVRDSADAGRLRAALAAIPLADLFVVSDAGRHDGAPSPILAHTAWPVVPRMVSAPPPDAMNRAAQEARGDFLCFLSAGLEPRDPLWLEELLSFAQLAEVGCVGAKLCAPDGTLWHGGYILGIGGIAGHAHRGLAPGQAGYFGRAAHHQSVSAVSSDAMVVRRSAFLDANGFDREAGPYADIDLCLKLGAAGWRTVWTPYAELRWRTPPQPRAQMPSAETLMNARWGAWLMADPAYNPNLTLDREDFSLAWPPRRGD